MAHRQLLLEWFANSGLNGAVFTGSHRSDTVDGGALL